MRMRKISAFFLALFAGAILAAGQSFCVKLSGDIPAEASKVLSQRFTQMLESEGFSVVDDAEEILSVTATVQERMETPGSMSQSVIVLNIKAKAKGQETVLTVRGVGKDDKDAWLRAVKQVLPRSRQAQEFLEKLK